MTWNDIPSLFNGEIYNYIEIKKDLAVYPNFNSDSDTEVLLASYDCYKEIALIILMGCFLSRFGIMLRTPYFARDRFGEKPFFYHIDKEDNFYFASEMKALWAVGVQRI
ncbi:MAG: hypothetical protein IPK03_01890 [Bacteroidetes bacterium]|nr:hypothetical protein [Bacteroidota bacterium]